jgi:hypothetical protein
MKIEVIQMTADYVRPIIKEAMGKQWVMNGQDNKMYKDIIASYYGSPTNSAIIDSYSRFVFGKGLNIEQDFIDKKELRKLCSDLVLFGECSIEVLPNGILKHADKSKILPSKSIDGEIQSYWYSFDWEDQMKHKPIEIAAYGFGTEKESQIYIISSYQIGQFYFNNPSYISSLPYCELEIELGNYYVNHVKNGLSFGHIINVNGGKPESEEDLKKHSKKIRTDLTGSTNAGKFLLSYNNNKDEETTVSALEVSNAHEQYQFLTEEAQTKICIAHKVVSGAILGINKSTGFSSTADEIEVAFNETYINVIQPFQELIIDAIEEIKGISDLDFVPLRQKATEENFAMSKVDINLDDFGEDIDLDEWELLESGEVNYDNEDETQELIKQLNEEHRLQLVGRVALASSGTARPNAKSADDGDLFKSRYRYSGDANPERDFCKLMMSKDKLYRKEDIDMMSNKNVNPGFGMNPTPNKPYDIWAWKGGGKLTNNFKFGTCKHFWVRETYLRRNDVNNPLAEQFTAAQARRAGEILPVPDDKRGFKAPHDM